MQFLEPCCNSYSSRCKTFFYFAMFILHLPESRLYCYILDGRFALAYELPFPRFMDCLPHKGAGFRLNALPKDTTSELVGLFSITSPKCRAPSIGAVVIIFFNLLVRFDKGIEPQVSDCKADALTTTPSYR